MKKLITYWPVVLGVIALIVWLVRLEAQVNDAAPKTDVAVSGQKLDDLKARVERIEQKVDTLLARKHE